MFKDREEAGQKLLQKLFELKEKKDLIVLAIPRGGLVVGKVLAQGLNCPLEVLVTKKIGASGNPEFAIGAVSAVGKPLIDEGLANQTGANENYLQKEIREKREEIKRRLQAYRGNKPWPDLKKKTVILTDDGVATGATMLVAVKMVRQQEPKKIIVAVPVTARDSLKKLEAEADEVVYLEAPLIFFAVGQFYQNFAQVDDKKVKELLR
jgi:putative phosphoribosyl transferase